MNYCPEVARNAHPDRLSRDLQLQLLTTMLRIRVFEERIGDMLIERDRCDQEHRSDPANHPPFPEEKRIRTPCHLYIGQEAVAVGVCAALDREDTVWSTHRAHGHYLAKGGDLAAAMAEIYCRSTGCSRGRGGSMHLCAPQVGFLGSSSIVAGTVSLGVGAGMAEKVKRSNRVSVVFHGDAVPEEGIFHEALNWAVLKSLPVIFCLEDNFYSTHLHIQYRRKDQDLSRLMRGYALPVRRVDGNDVREVLAAAAQAVADARSGAGPTLLHLRTYRWRGHVGAYDNLEVGLRSLEEVQKWIDRCPILLERDRLRAAGTVADEEIAEIERHVRDEVEQALQAAWRAPRPSAEELTRYVFKERKSCAS